MPWGGEPSAWAAGDRVAPGTLARGRREKPRAGRTGGPVARREECRPSSPTSSHSRHVTCGADPRSSACPLEIRKPADCPSGRTRVPWEPPAGPQTLPLLQGPRADEPRPLHAPISGPVSGPSHPPGGWLSCSVHDLATTKGRQKTHHLLGKASISVPLGGRILIPGIKKSSASLKSCCCSHPDETPAEQIRRQGSRAAPVGGRRSAPCRCLLSPG